MKNYFGVTVHENNSIAQSIRVYDTTIVDDLITIIDHLYN